MLRCVIVLEMHRALLQGSMEHQQHVRCTSADKQAHLYVLPAASVEDMYFAVAAADCQVMAIGADGGR